MRVDESSRQEAMEKIDEELEEIGLRKEKVRKNTVLSLIESTQNPSSF